MAKRLLFLGTLVVIAMSMQGCDYDVPSHVVGNWRGEEDYLITFEFIPPGGSAKDAKLNSCALDRLSQTLQCSGRGVCKLWDIDNMENPLAFCECDRGFADPECRSERKSQFTAFMWSLFFGFFGADLFYLGFPLAASCKLCTLGGFGIWWAWDLIRIGSAPVYAVQYRTADDLPHWAFVLIVVSFAMFGGFGVTYISTLVFRRRKRKDAMLMQAEEEQRVLSDAQSQQYNTSYESRNMRDDYGSMPVKNLGSV